MPNNPFRLGKRRDGVQSYIQRQPLSAINDIATNTSTTIANDTVRSAQLEFKTPTINPGNSVAAPMFAYNVGSGDLTISCTTSGATIFYGDNSPSSWTTYAGPFAVVSGHTIYSYATKTGLLASPQVQFVVP